jgi:tripartite-type tricarboxylate transporter receptor subunit TctC
MNLPRRQFLHLAAGAAVLPAISRSARAQGYPSRPVRIVIGYPAGTGPDIVARLIGQSLSERLGQQFIVDNRPGAGSNIATEGVVRAAPDGYTLLFVTTSNTINTSLYEHLNFDFARDIVPVGAVSETSFVLVVNPTVPVNTLTEFIAYARGNPGKFSMASQGNGSVAHVAGELFKTMAGVDMLHVPYRGSPMPDLLSGQVQVLISPISGAIGYITAGALRALAVTTQTRSDALPGIPTVGEFVSGYEASAWNGIGAPKNTPSDIIEKLNREISVCVADPKFKTRIVELGSLPLVRTPIAFRRLIGDETDKWGKVIRAANIKAG